jgi:hypothetical protein
VCVRRLSSLSRASRHWSSTSAGSASHHTPADHSRYN